MFKPCTQDQTKWMVSTPILKRGSSLPQSEVWELEKLENHQSERMARSDDSSPKHVAASIKKHEIQAQSYKEYLCQDIKI